MAKASGGTKENPHYGRQVRASDNPSARRVLDNHRESEQLEQDNYSVEKDLHKNGAYFAYIGKTHTQHEKSVGRIFAENGFSFTLDKEGNVKIKLPNGLKVTLPSVDGHVEKDFTHEIYALEGEPDARTVADGIAHSFKLFSMAPSKSVQADVAITIAPIGNKYHRTDIDEGVTEFNRRVESGEEQANPLIYLHIDEERRKIFHRRIAHKKRE